MRQFVLNLTMLLFRNIVRIFCIFPIKNNRIVGISYSGRQYSCSPKYIFEHLNSAYGKPFDLNFIIKQPEKYSEKDISFIKLYSIKSFYIFCTSKVIVSNYGIPKFIPKRKNQIVINTWHGGGAYKREEIPYESQPFHEKLHINYKTKSNDIVISSCKGFTKLFSEEYLHNYRGEFMACGMPRNDIMFDIKRDDLVAKVRQKFGIPTYNMVVLYAPTYRGRFYWHDESFKTNIDPKRVCNAIEKRFGKSSVFMYRVHYSESVSDMGLSEGIDARLYDDMQELLYAADILITDYSSSVWDFSFTKKPCFLYCPDLDYYLNEDRGVYTPIETWPGILCRTNEELGQAILSFDEAEYAKKVEKHHADLGSYETGHACEQVCKRIAEVCGIEEK